MRLIMKLEYSLKNGWIASHNDIETPDVIEIDLDNPSKAIEILKSYMQAVK